MNDRAMFQLQSMAGAMSTIFSRMLYAAAKGKMSPEVKNDVKALLDSMKKNIDKLEDEL